MTIPFSEKFVAWGLGDVEDHEYDAPGTLEQLNNLTEHVQNRTNPYILGIHLQILVNRGTAK